MTTNKPKSRIPEFKSYEEEAEFWDTHNIADYDEFERVELEVAKPLAHSLIIELDLDAKTITKLSTLARKQGIDINILVRMWLLEHLEEQEKKKQPQPPSSALRLCFRVHWRFAITAY
jgi:hypothetical protein